MKTLAILVAMTLPLASALAQDAQKQRCNLLYYYLYRYEFVIWYYGDTSVRLRSEIAKAMCDSGDTTTGIALLEHEMARAHLPIPSGG